MLITQHFPSVATLRKTAANHFQLLVGVGFVFAAIFWSLMGGKDLNWDQINYHFYLPFSLFDGRTSTDFLAANGQSYLNPLAYVPFYLMVKWGFPSVIIASVLAIIHASNAVLAYRITDI